MTASPSEVHALLRLAETCFGSAPLHPGRGTIPAHVMGDGNDFLEFADYRAGDDVRLIDWRTTARVDRPVVRRNRARAASRWTVLVDCSGSMWFGQRWNVACDLASAFSALLLQQSHRVGLALFDDELRASVPARSGALHLHEINAALSGVQVAQSGQLGSLHAALEHLTRPTGLIVLSDLFWGQDMERALHACRKMGGPVHVLRLGAREDTQIAPGAFGIADAESGLSRILARDRSERTALPQRNLATMERRAKQASRRAGAVFTSVRVEAGWKVAITAHLARAARRHA